jgi:hypothetical protein
MDCKNRYPRNCKKIGYSLNPYLIKIIQQKQQDELLSPQYDSPYCIDPDYDNCIPIAYYRLALPPQIDNPTLFAETICKSIARINYQPKFYINPDSPLKHLKSFIATIKCPSYQTLQDVFDTDIGGMILDIRKKLDIQNKKNLPKKRLFAEIE